MMFFTLQLRLDIESKIILILFFEVMVFIPLNLSFGERLLLAN